MGKHWRNTCFKKKAHYNFWTALQHCLSLQEKLPEARISLYQCRECDNIHLTTSHRLINGIRKALASNLRSMSKSEWWDRAPAIVIEKRIAWEMVLLREYYKLPKKDEDYEAAFSYWHHTELFSEDS